MSDSAKSVNSARTYQCRKCTKTFLTPQALGGHQRAHKQPHNNAGATSSPLASPTIYTNNITPRSPKYSPSYPPDSSTNNTWGGPSVTHHQNLPSSLNAVLGRPASHLLPRFPIVNGPGEGYDKGDAKMTNLQDQVDATLHLVAWERVVEHVVVERVVMVITWLKTSREPGQPNTIHHPRDAGMDASLG